MNEIERLRAAAQLEQNTATMDMARAHIERLRAALQKIADLVDSEMGEPLDEAIAIAANALRGVTQAPDPYTGCGRAVTEPWNDAAQTPSTRPHDAPEWLWYGEVDGKAVVTFGRWPKGGTRWRYKWAEIQPTEHDHQAPFHPDKALPDCMMPDGGECCEGYQALLDDWRRLRAVAQDQPTEVNIRRADKIAKMFDKPE